MGEIISHIPKLIEKRAAEREAEEHTAGNKLYKFSLSEIQRETGLAYSVVHAWARDKVTTYNRGVLQVWCEYLGVQPGDILEYKD